MLKFGRKSLEEKFLLLHVLPRGMSAVFLAIDAERNLIPKKIWNEYSVKRFLRSRFGGVQEAQLIVSADPALATTISLPVELARESEAPLELPELENMLSQVLSRVFVECRTEAARRLSIDELNMVLVSASPSAFKVDRHSVLNPTGFRAKRVSASLDLTFTTRDVFDELMPLFSRPEGLFFTESARAALANLVKLQPPPVNLIRFDDGAGRLFILDTVKNGKALYREDLDWKVEALFAAISAAIGVDSPVARVLYNRYLANDVSPRASRFLAKALKPAQESFAKAIQKAKISGRTYFDSRVPVDDVLGRSLGRVRFAKAPFGEMLQKFGFATNVKKWRMPDREVARRLAPFLEFHSSKSSLPINQKMRRHLHWLMRDPAEHAYFS